MVCLRTLLLSLLIFSTTPHFAQTRDRREVSLATHLSLYAQDTFKILKEMLNHPIEVGAFSSSSPWLIDEILKPVSESKDPLNMLEIGFGPGTVMRQIINEYLQDGDHLDGVEFVEKWVDMVQAEFPAEQYPNVHLYHADFSEWETSLLKKTDCYDVIISTIPISKLPQSTMEKIYKKIASLLRPGGKFVYITLIGAETVAGLVSCGEKNSEKYRFFEQWTVTYFNEPSNAIVLRNCTPAYVRTLTKKALQEEPAVVAESLTQPSILAI